MKQQNTKSTLLLGILAALLAAGCAAAAFGGWKKQSEKPDTTDVRWENGTVLHLTDQADEPSMHGRTRTESGMFYSVTRTEFVPDPELINRIVKTNGFKYYDAESGQTAWLCARPNCMHDGDEFCTATTSNYEVLTEPVWLDGYVYAVAQDHSAQLSTSNLRYTTVLLRYAPDGTDVTKVAELFAEPQSEEDRKYEVNAILIAHRGHLWMKCAYQIQKDASDATLGIKKYNGYGGYGLFVYAPADGELTKIYGTDKTERFFTAWTHYERMIGLGDYIYFYKQTGWHDPLKRQGIFRLDCTTGQAEKLILEKANHDITYFAAAGSQLVYFDQALSKKEESGFVVYDPATGEETPLITAQELFETQHPGKSAWTAERDAYREPFILSCMLCDESHIFIVWNSQPDLEEKDTYSWLTVCNWSGAIEQTLEITKLPNVTDSTYIESWLADRPNMSASEQKKIREKGIEQDFAYKRVDMFDGNAPLHYENGIFYLEGNDREYQLSLAELLSGSGGITPIFSYD